MGRIGLYLVKLKLNYKELWYAVEDATSANIHHLDLKGLCQMEYANKRLKPKRTGKEFSGAIEENLLKLFGESEKTVELMNLVCRALSLTKRKTNYQLLYDILMEQKDALLQGESNRCEAAIDLIYHWISCKPSISLYTKRKHYHRTEIGEIIRHYQDELIGELEAVSTDHLTKLALAIYLGKVGKFDVLLKRVERESLRRLNEFDHVMLPQLLRSFTHCYDNQGFGDDRSFVIYESKVSKLFEKMNPRDQTELMFTYANRQQGNP